MANYKHTHRKQARLVAYTGHESNNKTLPFVSFVHLKALRISCEGPLPLRLFVLESEEHIHEFFLIYLKKPDLV